VKGGTHTHPSWVTRVHTRVHSSRGTDVHTCALGTGSRHACSLCAGGTEVAKLESVYTSFFLPFLETGKSCCLKPQNGQQPLCKTKGITASSCLKQGWGELGRIYVVRFYVHVLGFVFISNKLCLDHRSKTVSYRQVVFLSLLGRHGSLQNLNI